MMQIRMNGAVLEEMGRRAVKAYPEECCGLLVGTLGTGGNLLVRQAVAAGNAADQKRRRYRVEPRDYVAADTAARVQEMDVVGVYHSHPDHPAVPSATDGAEAWEGYVYVIVSVMARRVAEMRAWRIAPDRPPEEITMVEA